MRALAGSVDTWTKRALALLLVGVPVALNPWALDPYDLQTQLLRFLSTVILVGCAVKAVRGQGVPLDGQRAAAEQAWAEAARCDPTATEYRRQFLRRVERVDRSGVRAPSSPAC